MKARNVAKLAISVSIAGLCLGFLLFFLFSLGRDRNSPAYNLFSLVPSSAIAVVETERMDQLVHDINDLSEADVDSLMGISDMLMLLRSYMQPLLNETPHGFSREMDNMLISFHEPGTNVDQVMYCCLNTGDLSLLKNSLLKYFPSNFPSETYGYHGNFVEIYSWEGTKPIYATYTTGYLVLSYSKALIEEVIDTKLNDNSLLKDVEFGEMVRQQHADEAALLYVKKNGWKSYSVNVGERAIYLTDLSESPDSLVRFFDLLDLDKELDKPILIEN